MSFELRELDLSPAELHAAEFDTHDRLLIVPKLHAQRTLVLGSTQPEAQIDTRRCAERGIEIARRRSGGGAVLVSEEDLVWIDLVIGSDDRLWTADVGRAFEWVGRAMQRGLRTLGHPTAMHTGALITSRWSRQICFSGTGPGELLIDGRKVVGISQRRTRDAARFQVAILRRWSGAEHADLLLMPDHERNDVAAALDAAAVGISNDPSEIVEAVAAELPR